MVAEHRLRYRPQGDALRRFHQSSALVRFIFGPFGSAKTTGCMTELYRRAREQKPDRQGVRRTRWAVVRSTYPELETTTIKSWRAIFDRPEGILGKFRNGHPPDHLLRFTMNDGTRVESEFIFLAMDREEDVDKLLSLELTGIYYNELSELPRVVVTVGIGRIGRYPAMRDGGPTWYGIVGDTNGMPEDHWFYDIAEKEAPQNWKVFRQPGAVVRVGNSWELNPKAENLKNLPPDYYANMLTSFTDEEITVYMACGFALVKSGKPIWAGFNDTLHVADIDPVPGIPVSMGADWGLTPAAVLGQVLPNGSAIIFDEVVTEDADAKDLARLINHKMTNEYPDFEIDSSRLTGDPSGVTRMQTDKSQNVFAIMGAENLPFRPASTNDWDVRVSAISQPLAKLVGGKPQLMIARRCTYLRGGMAGRYAYRKMPSISEAKYAEKPDKNIYSHVCEAEQYWGLGVGFGRKATRKTNVPQQAQADTEFEVM